MGTNWRRYRRLKKEKEIDQKNEKSRPQGELYTDLGRNLEKIRDAFGASGDLQIRRFMFGKENAREAAAVFLEGITDEARVRQLIDLAIEQGNVEGNQSLEKLAVKIGSATNAEIASDWDTLFLALLSGSTALFIADESQAITGSTEGGARRSVMEPSAQLIIRGPRESFTESIGTNAALVRRRVKTPFLRLEAMTIGSLTKTKVAVMYIEGIAKDNIVHEVKERLKAIETDRILESGYIEEYIQDQTFTPFPTVYNTERPDAIAGNLLEGKVAIFVDGTPFVLVVPVTFVQFFQSPADYYQRADIGSFLRTLRFVTFVVSLLTPSLYIALITFHQEMIPTTLLISLAAQHEGVPFPTFIEALLMELTFEVLREAGIRMPRAVGQAVSIAGALVIGEAAVQAGLVSPAMVIVVALTGIASFATPSYNIAISARLLRFFMMVLAATFGLYGIVLGMIILIAHMSGLRSFGIPYLKPFAPLVWEDLKDSMIRAPLWMMKTRPEMIAKDVGKKPTKAGKKRTK